MDIEKLATSAVDESISKTDRLSSYINSKDKEPCWDGNIYIHEGKRHEKKNIKRVSTQVKGKLVRNGTIKDRIKYQISYDDLKAYMMNGGTVFFVVYLDNVTGDKLQIYYTPLLPIKIKNILKTKKSSYRLEFKKFPNENSQKVEVLLNFYYDALKQASFVNKEVPTIEELKKQGVLESLTFQYTGVGTGVSHRSLPKKMNGQSLTIYANTKGGSIPIPVEYYDSISKIVLSGECEIPVSVSDKIFYSKFTKVTTAELEEWHIGSCVKVFYPNDEKTQNNITISIKISGTLKEQIKGIEFVLALIKEKSFVIGTVKIPVVFDDESLNVIKFNELPEILDGYKKLLDTLTKLNVKKDLDLSNCNEQDIANLNWIVSAIGDKKLVKEKTIKNTAQFQRISIANIKLALVVFSDKKGNCKVYDYFSEKFVLQIEDENKKLIKVPQYYLLSKEDYLTIDNLNFNSIIEDFGRLERNQYICEIINLMFLEILKAYDVNKSKEALDTAEKILNWLKISDEFFANEVLVINELQLLFRKRKLTVKEKGKLYTILENSQEDIFKLGALILLEEHNDANALLTELSDEDAKRFKDFPIYNLFHPQEDTTHGQT